MSRLWATLSLIMVLTLLLLAAQPRAVEAQEGGRAAVVVRFGDERTASRCVAFSEPEISGYELLQRSGLDIVVKSESQGGLVCAIDGTGCGLEDCLCQCRGEPCVYWSYWRGEDDGWAYATAGATVRRVQNGGIDGWSWGPGSVTSAIEPPIASFEDICQPDAPVYGTAPTPLRNPASQWISYVGFGFLVFVLAGAALVASRRRSGQ